jgi:hypothetical protein
VARTGSGDVYAGRDGNVYRRQDGSWQKFENGSWGSVERPTPQNRTAGAGGGTNRADGAATRPATTPDTVQQLNRDRAARAEGTSRTRDFSTTRSSGNRSSGSYRPSGGSRAGASRGGARGGGRRR